MGNYTGKRIGNYMGNYMGTCMRPGFQDFPSPPTCLDLPSPAASSLCIRIFYVPQTALAAWASYIPSIEILLCAGFPVAAYLPRLAYTCLAQLPVAWISRFPVAAYLLGLA